ncbi:MAG: class I SAM-dependent methyltransferase [Ktedonobacteraceae bacterium]|nr:class I SAM-dependent methyltransferase [Ktedonobacteraceae bacterium]MBO0795045.1 class I SAM-dependent methyltransferase [Ktedonobacteraceae bacterium]
MTQDASGYPIDTENVSEMARLTRQGRVYTAAIGLLPERMTLAPGQSVLDIGCGPGEWVLAMAEQHRDVRVTGIDVSQLMTQYARMMADERGLQNLQLRVMDARATLDFPDESFDLVHSRLVGGFLSAEGWPAYLAECYRVLKPGGIFMDVETDDMGISTSPSLTRLMSLGMASMRRTGHCFNSEGDHGGLAAIHPRLLRDAGFSALRREAFPLDFSFGSEAHEEMVQDWAIVFRLGMPFIARLGLASEDDLRVLYARAIEEMRDPDFSAVVFVQRIWGVKAEA